LCQIAAILYSTKFRDKNYIIWVISVKRDEPVALLLERVINKLMMATIKMLPISHNETVPSR